MNKKYMNMIYILSFYPSFNPRGENLSYALNQRKLHVALVVRGNKLQFFNQNCKIALIRGRVKLEELRYSADIDPPRCSDPDKFVFPWSKFHDSAACSSKRVVIYEPFSKAFSELCQTSKTERFMNIANDF